MPVYVIDASIWIHIWQHHPPDIFAGLREQLRTSIANGELTSPEEVLHELERGSDDLAKELAEHEGLFAPLDEPLMKAVTEVMATAADSQRLRPSAIERTLLWSRSPSCVAAWS